MPKMPWREVSESWLVVAGRQACPALAMYGMRSHTNRGSKAVTECATCLTELRRISWNMERDILICDNHNCWRDRQPQGYIKVTGRKSLNFKNGDESMLVSHEWITEHEHDLDDYEPKIEIVRPGSKQTITIKSKEAEREVIKIMRENKKKGEAR